MAALLRDPGSVTLAKPLVEVVEAKVVGAEVVGAEVVEVVEVVAVGRSCWVCPIWRGGVRRARDRRVH